MANTISLSDMITWSNPLTYLFITILFVLFKSIRLVIHANHVLREGGIQLSYNLFGNRSGNLLKWTAMHETKTGVIMILVVILGVIIAISSGS
ncbi:MAG: hypothetical protein JNL63_08935 [Bacteroidia bacterium]|nr:hypothetical protein [Bacteroidia bacterium]